MLRLLAADGIKTVVLYWCISWQLYWKHCLFCYFQLLCNGPGTCVPLCLAAFLSTV